MSCYQKPSAFILLFMNSYARGVWLMYRKIVGTEPPDSAHVTAWLKLLSERYSGLLEISEIGRSLMGRSIFSVHIGNSRRKALYCGGVHGREWITTLLMMNFLEDLLKSVSMGDRICEMDICRLLTTGGLTVIPALNPDGVEISINGDDISRLSNFLNDALIKELKSGEFRRRWKANARGVDINRNFNAGWDDMRVIAAERGITGPSPFGWTGKYPVSEPETRAVTELCEREDFRHLIAFHSSGEEIYWSYRQFTPPRAHIMAKILATSSGYSLNEPDIAASAAGLKDWFMERFNSPAFTVEVGNGESPLPLSSFPFLYNRLREMLVLGIAM